jgi:four helix bundle protein
MNSHKDLKVWKDSIMLVKMIYTCGKAIDSTRFHSLMSQIYRSAESIPSNIAEGAARRGDKEFPDFLNISLG